MNYHKHLVRCRCVLPQFKNSKPPVFHAFTVFSVIEDNGDVQPSFASCLNCGIIHKVTEIGMSTILSKEDMPSLLTIDEIKSSIPEQVVKLIESYDLPISTWQEISFIFEHQMWAKNPVILTKELVDGVTVGKYLAIISSHLYQVKSFTEETYAEIK